MGGTHRDDRRDLFKRQYPLPQRLLQRRGRPGPGDSRCRTYAMVTPMPAGPSADRTTTGAIRTEIARRCWITVTVAVDRRSRRGPAGRRPTAGRTMICAAENERCGVYADRVSGSAGREGKLRRSRAAGPPPLCALVAYQDYEGARARTGRRSGVRPSGGPTAGELAQVDGPPGPDPGPRSDGRSR